MAKPLLTDELWQGIGPHIPPQPHGRPRRRPDEVLADRAYDVEDKIRKPLRKRKTTRLIAKRNTINGSAFGKFRYVVEAAFGWLFNQRRLRVRCEKRDDIHQAFLEIRILQSDQSVFCIFDAEIRVVVFTQQGGLLPRFAEGANALGRACCRQSVLGAEGVDTSSPSLI